MTTDLQRPSASAVPHLLPLARPQRRIWVLEQLHPGTSLGNIAGLMTIAGPVDPATLALAVERFIQSTETLRMELHLHAGEPMQAVSSRPVQPVPVVDVRGEPEPERAGRSWAASDARVPFQLLGAPLHRFAVLAVAPDRVWLYACIHHLISDAASLALFARGVTRFYEALIRGEDASPTAHRHAGPYLPFVRTEQAYLDSERARTDLSAWRESFATLEEPSLLGELGDGLGSTEAERHTLMLGPERTARIHALAEATGSTPSRLFTALTAAFVGKLTGRRDVTLGTFIHNRFGREDLRRFGMFVSTVPLRVRVDPDATLGALLQDAGAALTRSLRHSRFPYEQLLQELPGSLRRGLFDVVVSYQSQRYDGAIDGHPVAIDWLFCGHEGHALVVQVSDRTSRGVLQVDLDFRAAGFPRGIPAELTEAFEAFLEAALSGGAQVRMAELPLASTAQAHRLAAHSPDFLPPLPERTLLERIAARVRLQPGTLAVAPSKPASAAAGTAGSEALAPDGLTYAGLWARAGGLARQLVARGAGPGSVVLLCLHRTSALLCGQLGVLRAGAAYLPVEPDLPLERLRGLVLEAGVRCAIVDARTGALARALGLEAVRADLDDPASPAQEDGELPLPGGGDLAYVIYTSGSSGKPKGVMVEHGALLNFAEGMRTVLPLEGAQRSLCTTSLSFDIHVLETLVPLSLGLTVVLADEEAQTTPALLAVRILEAGAGLAQLTPSRLQVLLEHPAGREAVASLRALFVGGEALPPALVAKVHAATGARLFNLYGPTETTVWSTAAELRPEDAVHVGRPIRNTRAHVVAAGGELLPPGMTGELHLGGDGLARGYLAQPALTAERFLTLPFSPGERLYRTGDLARWRADGTLEHRGRADHQVKVRGHRVELQEIEAHLLASGMVSAAAVVRREDASGDAWLVAFHVPRETATGLREHLLRVLPAYMVPSQLVPLEALPVLPSGKVDRRALLTLLPVTDPDARERTPPATPLEQQVLALWQEVLNETGFGVTDDFFELGGTSLSAIRVTNLISQRLGQALPVSRLFTAPTVRALSLQLGAMPAAQLPLVRAPAAAHDPVTTAQRRLYLLQERSGEGDTRYHMSGAVRLERPAEPAALETALRVLVQRHDALRTSFAVIEGEVRQRVHAEVPFALEQVALPGASPAEALRAFVRPFALDRAPLFRAGLHAGADGALLLVDLHHLVADATSIGLLTDELEALLDGRDLPAPALQPRDWAVWREDRPAAPDAAAVEALLSGWPEPLELVPSAPRTESTEGALHHSRLTPSLVRALEGLARREHTTLHNVLLTAWASLLGRHAASSEVVIGSPVLGRPHAALETVVGMFVETVPLRLGVGPEVPFRSLLAAASERSSQSLALEHGTLDALLDGLGRRGRPAPFDFLFVLLSPRTSRGPRRLTLLGELIPSAKCELTLTAEPTDDGGLALQWTWPRGRFEADWIHRFAARLSQLLEQLPTAVDRPMEALALLLPEDRETLARFNDTTQPHPVRTLPELIAEQVSTSAGRLAVWHEGRSLTYAQLDARSNQLARTLRARGVGPEARVGILASPSLEMVVALWGVIKAGGAYVPLDPSHPPERLALLLEDSGIRLLLVDGAVERPAGAALPRGCELLELNDAATYDASEAPVPSVSRPEHLLYVIYTSGTTGRPKGVMMEHRQLCNQLHWLRRFFREAGPLRHMLLVSPAVDVSVHQIFLPLMRGDALHLPTYETTISAADLRRYVVEHRIDVVDSVPQHVKELLEEGRDLEPLSLAFLCFGGDVLGPGVLRLAERAARFGHLINYYGPTETCLNATGLMARGWNTSDRVPIGLPCDNYQLHILDAGLRRVPPGVPGELYVGGAGVARGYQGRPELTAERFLPDPFTPGGRLYRTGDLARWRDDGQVDFLGRADGQVKIQGFRVETAEVESLLLQSGLVRDGLVDAAERGGSGKRLFAFVVPEPGVTVVQLRAHLKALLPRHMLPTGFLLLERLPLTLGGKVDRAALWRQADEAVVTTEPGPALSATAEGIAAVWREVLGVEEVRAGDNFFELGGQSLLAIQVLNRLRTTFGVEVPLRTLFVADTLADLAASLDALLAERRGALVPILPRTVRGSPHPLSFSQLRLWVLDQLEPGSPFYNVAGGLRLRGALAPSDVESAVRALVERHEALRTHFVREDGLPTAVIEPIGRFSLEVETPAPGEDWSDARLGALVAEKARTGFDLERGPLLRVVVSRLDEELHLLTLVVHHIVSDGWSLEVLLREFAQLLEGARTGHVPALPPLAVQYGDYATWQREWMQGAVLERALAVWRARLGESPPILELPTDFARPPLQTFRGDTHRFALDAGSTAALRALARAHNTTLYTVLLASFDALLFRLTRQAAIVVGTPIANRHRAGVEGVVGCFVNTLAIRADVDGRLGFAALVDQLRDRMLEAQEHQDLPFDKLVEHLHAQRDLSRSPIFQVMFAMEEAPEATLQLAGLHATPIEAETGTAKFDLTLNVVQQQEGLALTFEFNTDLFRATTVGRMAGHLCQLLEAALAGPGIPLDRLPLLTPEEQRSLATLCGEDLSLPLELPVHRLFEAQALRTPGAPALWHEDQTLDYAALEARANRLAHLLRLRGVRPGDRVGICLPRSPDTFAAFLAVLKAGAAYVPMDPAYPRERLAHMLEDSGARLLISGREHLGWQPDARTGLLLVDDWEPALAASASTPLPLEVHPEAPAYLIYTSGSTGVPKAVVIPHRALAAYSLGAARHYGLGPRDRVLQFSTISFDSSVEEIYPCLLSGGTLVLRTEAMLDSVRTFLATVGTLGLTHLVLPTAYWNELVSELVEGGLSLPASVRMVGSGGEKMPPAKVQQWKERVGAHVLLTNEYGPTETTVVTAVCDLAEVGAAQLATAEVPIGRAVANARLYVLDPQLEPVPVGIPGELWVGGKAVAHGYLGRPDLTSERFVPDPFDGSPGARCYRTGDLVRRLPDGMLEYLGRIDHQVKIRGFRVELGEIEAVLGQHPQVREVAVQLREDVPGLKQLVAYVVPTPLPPETTELRAFVRGRLPEYMVPQAVVQLPAMPLSPGGKVDRARLPAPERPAGSTSAPPSTDTERTLAGLWEPLLQREGIGVEDDFFELGGHSLLATQLVARAREALGVELSLRLLFENPRLGALALAVDQLPRTGAAPAPRIARADRSQVRRIKR